MDKPRGFAARLRNSTAAVKTFGSVPEGLAMTLPCSPKINSKTLDEGSAIEDFSPVTTFVATPDL